MKKILFICFSLTWATSSFASNQLSHILHLNWPNHATQEVKKSLRSNEDGYTDFSGAWVGTCNDSDFQEEMVIYNNDSHIELDGISFAIDGISTLESKENDRIESITTHFRWDDEGKEILATIVAHVKEGNLSRGELYVYSGKSKLSILNGQLVKAGTISRFVDGSSLGDEINFKCVYKKEN